MSWAGSQSPFSRPGSFVTYTGANPPDLEQVEIAEALLYAASLIEDRIIPLAPTGS